MRPHATGTGWAQSTLLDIEHTNVFTQCMGIQLIPIALKPLQHTNLHPREAGYAEIVAPIRAKQLLTMYTQMLRKVGQVDDEEKLKLSQLPRISQYDTSVLGMAVGNVVRLTYPIDSSGLHVGYAVVYPGSAIDK